MKVLGIHIGHDSSAALIVDRRISFGERDVGAPDEE